MSRVLCRRGLERGARSAAFTVDQLLEALQTNDTQYVYAELDGAGRVTAAGGGGPARLCARAALAPSAPARGAELQLAPPPSRHPHPARGAELQLAPPPSRHPHPARGAELQLAPPPSCRPHPHPAPELMLRVAAPLAPQQELLLWFADDALAALDMPVLTPRNFSARRDYAYHDCGARFADPTPLKLHLFLRCGPPEPRRFWAEAGERLRAAPPPAALRAAELEALAAAWGRSGAGHACVYCGKLYSRRYGLKIHLRTHTGYRPLRCRYCLRAFGDPSNLNKHVRLHLARLAAPAPAPGCK